MAKKKTNPVTYKKVSTSVSHVRGDLYLQTTVWEPSPEGKEVKFNPAVKLSKRKKK